jgi:hypothetical protein
LCVFAAVHAAAAAEFSVGGMAWYGMHILHLGDEVLFIPQCCLSSMCSTLGICSEAHVSRCLERLTSKSVLAADGNQQSYFRSKGCVPQNTTRLNLLSNFTMVRLAMAVGVPANIVQELQALDPGMAAAATSSRAQEAAAKAVGVPSAAADAAVAANAAAAATTNRPPPLPASIAAAIPSNLPVDLPVVVLTDEELHVNR